MFPLAGLVEELGAARHDADELRRRLNDVQDQRKAFSIVALSIFRVMRAEELLLIDRLQALPGCIRAAMSLGACHGAMTALASVQLRSSLHLGEFKPGFPETTTASARWGGLRQLVHVVARDWFTCLRGRKSS